MVYLIHLNTKYKHAQHYIGFVQSANNLLPRLNHHRKGTGSKFLAAVSAGGGKFEIVRVWTDGNRTFERKLKNRKDAPRICPVCNAKLKNQQYNA